MSSNLEFKIGDLVKLKSGGPDMTVRHISVADDGSVNYLSCQWFAGKKLDDGRFPKESLDLVPKT